VDNPHCLQGKAVKKIPSMTMASQDRVADRWREISGWLAWWASEVLRDAMPLLLLSARVSGDR